MERKYVGQQACYSCHQQEYNDWKGSHHDWAMAEVSTETVLGNFQDVEVTIDGVQYHFTNVDSQYFAKVVEFDGSEQLYEIEYTFGVSPLQQYITRLDQGRHQVLRATWDSDKGLWYHQYEGREMKPTDWLHWTRGGQNWNTMCAECHSTELRRNYDWAADTFNTTGSSINVSCEACHGPGSRHVAWAKGGEYGENMHILNTIDQKGQIDNCGPCHARRVKLTDDLNPLLPFDEQYVLQTATPEYYHPDGQILEEDYVLGSFLQSEMFHNHVKCTDCHDPHSMNLKFIGNQLCMQCHEPKYNTEAHHFHPMATESADCVSCHMRGAVYMGNDFRRDHSFRIPRPDQSMIYGTPNACTSCHTERSDQWAADQVEQWYGPERPSRHSDIVLASTSADIAPADRQAILAFINDTAETFFNRATVIDNYNFSFTEPELATLVNAMNDSASLVRRTAIRQFINMPPQERHAVGMRFIGDTSLSIRIAAAELLSDIDRASIPAEQLPTFEAALKEYEKMLYTNADFPVGRVQLGDYFMRTGKINDAIAQYRIAIEKDSLTPPAYTNLATAYSQTGRNAEAMQVLDALVRVEPEFGRGYYLRALLSYELGDESSAIRDFNTAIELNPLDFRSSYNLATLYYQRKEFSKAEAAITKGLSVNPNSGDGQYLLALIYRDQGRMEEASRIMRDLQTQQAQTRN